MLVLLVAGVWGTWLAPKRRIDSPLRVRITLELALFVIAGIGLAVVGHALWGALLVGAEVVAMALHASAGRAHRGLPVGLILVARHRG